MIHPTHVRTWPLVVAIASGAFAGCTGQDIVVNLGDSIQHDDFIYRVTHVRTMDRIGPLRPSGTYHAVTVVVENHAGRVNHVWNNTIAYLIAGDGQTFENDTHAQQALDRLTPFGWQDRYVTPAEETAHTTLVFDVPTGATPLYVKVRGELLMGDVFAFNRYQRTRVRLP